MTIEIFKFSVLDVFSFAGYGDEQEQNVENPSFFP